MLFLEPGEPLLSGTRVRGGGCGVEGQDFLGEKVSEERLLGEKAFGVRVLGGIVSGKKI